MALGIKTGGRRAGTPNRRTGELCDRLADLGVDAELVGLTAATSAVEEAAARPPRTAGEIVTDEDGSGATALTEFLASKKFI